MKISGVCPASHTFVPIGKAMYGKTTGQFKTIEYNDDRSKLEAIV